MKAKWGEIFAKYSVRFSAIIGFLICTIIRIIFNEFEIVDIIYDLCAATGIVLLFTTCIFDIKTINYISISYLFVFVSLCILEQVLASNYRDFVRYLGLTLLIFPHCVFLTIKFFKMIYSKELLSKNWNGVEVLVALSRGLFAIYYLSIICAFVMAYNGILSSYFSYVIILLLILVLFGFQLVKGGNIADILIANSAANEPTETENKTDEIEALFQPMNEADDVQMQGLYTRFLEYMREKKPYLQDSCSVDDMAKELFTNKTYLSKMVNICTSFNFPKLMNLYRIKYAVDLYKKDPYLKVCELATMSGFHNTTSFNMAFKLFLNDSPSDWCKHYREKNNIR